MKFYINKHITIEVPVININRNINSFCISFEFLDGYTINFRKSDGDCSNIIQYLLSKFRQINNSIRITSLQLPFDMYGPYNKLDMLSIMALIDYTNTHFKDFYNQYVDSEWDNKYMMDLILRSYVKEPLQIEY